MDKNIRPLEKGELALWNIIKFVFWVLVGIGLLSVLNLILFSHPLATIVVLLVLILLNQGTRGV